MAMQPPLCQRMLPEPQMRSPAAMHRESDPFELPLLLKRLLEVSDHLSYGCRALGASPKVDGLLPSVPAVREAKVRANTPAAAGAPCRRHAALPREKFAVLGQQGLDLSDFRIGSAGIVHAFYDSQWKAAEPLAGSKRRVCFSAASRIRNSRWLAFPLAPTSRR